MALFLTIACGRLPDAYDRHAKPVEYAETLLDGSPARIIEKGDYKPERAEGGLFTGRIVDLRI